MASTVERVFVAGAGLMGHGIAQVHAAIGKAVVLYEPTLERAQAGRDRIDANLARAIAKGRLTEAERATTMDRIEATDRIALAADADVLIEAVFEDLAVKQALWRELDHLVGPDAIFASNTSSISIHRLAEAVQATRRPRFLGMHFFSPVPVMPLVELIRSADTSNTTVASIRELSTELGKQVIVSADRPGFIVNRILMPFLAEAIRALEQGIGSADDIDTGARIGLNHPMGPLELADFIGLDVCLEVMRVLDDGLGGDRFRPPQRLVDLVGAGHLGQKTGQGFHTYPRPPR